MTTERPVIPGWIYPAAFWLAVALLSLGLVWRPALVAGVVALMVSPAVTALIVAVAHWRRDRRLSVAALLALLGLLLVVVLRPYVDAWRETPGA